MSNVNEKGIVTANVGGEVTPEVVKESMLEKLMQEKGIATFVPLARVVGMEPQPLYGRKNHKTGTYHYDKIEGILLKKAAENSKGLETIEAIVDAAVEYLKEKNAKKSEKKTKKKEKEATPEFKIGDLVEYDTHRAVDGVREYYTKKGEIVDLLSEGKTAKARLICDDKNEVEISLKKLRLQVIEAKTE